MEIMLNHIKYFEKKKSKICIECFNRKNDFIALLKIFWSNKDIWKYCKTRNQIVEKFEARAVNVINLNIVFWIRNPLPIYRS